MSDEDDDKTDQLSQRRMHQAEEEGRLPIGRDAVMVAGLMTGVLALAMAGPKLRDALVSVVGSSVRQAALHAPPSVPGAARDVLLWTLVVCAAAALGPTVAVVIQTQGRFWPQLAMPTVERLTQGKLTRILTKDFWVELLMGLAKVAVIAAVAWFALKGELMTIRTLVGIGPMSQLSALFEPLLKAAVKISVALGFLAGLDLWFTRSRFFTKMKMTKSEAKREHREEEGDPMLKGKRRRKARELAKGRAAVEVPRADAVIVNPTHVAIAIRYRKDEGKAPRVIAKGKGQLAEIMRDLARSNGVPIVQDIPLARMLYKRVKVGGSVPADTYKAVAAILAFVYRVTGKSAAA